MQIYLKLALFAALCTPNVSFAPSFSGKHKVVRNAAADVDNGNEIKTTTPSKEAHDMWVVKELNRGPPRWFQEDQQQSNAKSQVKEYDWFSTALEADSPTHFLVNKQESGMSSLKNLRDCDWFADAMAPSAPIIPKTSLPLDKAPTEWFTHAIHSGAPTPHKRHAATEWFADAIQSGTPAQPAVAPSLTEGPSGWFAQAIASNAPAKPSEAPPLDQGPAGWFSQAIKTGVVEPPKTLTAALTTGPNEWFSQQISSSVPASPQVTPVGVPPGPSEWFTDAMASMAPSVAAVETKQEMTPHEWFTAGLVESAPAYPAAESMNFKATPREWFMEALGELS